MHNFKAFIPYEKFKCSPKDKILHTVLSKFLNQWHTIVYVTSTISNNNICFFAMFLPLQVGMFSCCLVDILLAPGEANVVLCNCFFTPETFRIKHHATKTLILQKWIEYVV